MSTKKRLDEYRRYGWKVNEENLRTLPTSAPRAAHDLAKWQTLEGRRSSRSDVTVGKIAIIRCWTEQNPPTGHVPLGSNRSKEDPVQEVQITLTPTKLSRPWLQALRERLQEPERFGSSHFHGNDHSGQTSS